MTVGDGAGETVSSLVDLRPAGERVAPRPAPSFPDDLECYLRALRRASRLGSVAAQDAGYPAVVAQLRRQTQVLAGFEDAIGRLLGTAGTDETT